MTHVLAIVNPIAGACRRQELMRSMLDRLRAMGLTVEIWNTAAGGHGVDLARQAVTLGGETGRLYVIAAGGDGTVREVAEGLAGSTVPLLIWPTGTENLVAKSLGYWPRPDIIPTCITAGRTVALDLGIANGRHFLVVAGVGFDAEVVERLVQSRTGHITHLSYTDPIWRTFWTHKFPMLRVIHEDRLWWEGRGMAFVGNMSRYSLGLPVVRDARPDDGLLDLLILPCQGHLKLLAHSARTVFARHVEHGGSRYLRFAGKIRIESDERVPVELDGDLAGCLPLNISILPKTLYFRLPPA